MDPLDELLALIGEPRCEVPPIDWNKLKTATDLEFPHDYKIMCQRYPPLGFGDFLGVFHPLAVEEGVNLVLWADEILSSAKGLAEEFSELDLVPYPIHPEHGGIFPWSVTDDGGHLFWLTEGESDSWPVIVAARDYGPGNWWEYRGSMSSFLVDVMTIKISCPLLPSTFPRPETGISQYPESLAVPNSESS